MGKTAKVAGSIATLAFMYYWITTVFSDAAYILNLDQASDWIYRLSGMFALIFIVATFIYAVATKNKALLALFLILFLIVILGWFRWFG